MEVLSEPVPRLLVSKARFLNVCLDFACRFTALDILPAVFNHILELEPKFVRFSCRFLLADIPPCRNLSKGFFSICFGLNTNAYLGLCTVINEFLPMIKSLTFQNVPSEISIFVTVLFKRIGKNTTVHWPARSSLLKHNTATSVKLLSNTLVSLGWFANDTRANRSFSTQFVFRLSGLLIFMFCS